MGIKDHSRSIAHKGRRDEIDLKVITDDRFSERIEVQCTVCDKRFRIPRSSKRQEISKARQVHYDRCSSATLGDLTRVISLSSSTPSSAGSSVFMPDQHVPSSVVVPPTTEDGKIDACAGRKFLKLAGADDIVLSVHREESSGVPMLHAKMVDQTLQLLGREIAQGTTGYPRVMYQKGSVVDLEDALVKCCKRFRQSKAYRKERVQRTLESNREWRERVAAFSLLANPKACRLEDFTADNLDKCIELFCETLPHDPENGIYDKHDGSFIGIPPRSGTGVPPQYMWTCEKDCILDYHPPGSMDSPVNLFPVLIDIVARDRSSDRHEVILQISSGEHVKTWMSIWDDGPECLSLMERLFPQVRTLIERPLFQVAFWEGESFPPPERVVPKLENVRRLTSNEQLCRMLEFKEGKEEERPLMSLLGLTKEDVCMPPPKDDGGGAERRVQLKREILESKADECLALIASVNPENAMLTPGIDVIKQYNLDGPTDAGPTLESQTKRLLLHVGTLPLRARPRKLPPFDSTIEELENYTACDSVHRSIAALHARQGDRGDGAINLDKKTVQQLEAYWSTLTQ